MKTTALFREIKLNRARLILLEHQDSMWATNSYWMVRLPEADNPFAKLLAEYNLPWEPMVCEIGRTIKRTNGKQPHADVVGGFVPNSVTTETHTPVRRHLLAGADVFVSSTTGPTDTAEVWERDDSLLVVVNRRFRALMDDLTRGEWHHKKDAPFSPLVKVDDGTVKALLMPIRHVIEDGAVAPGAAPKLGEQAA